MDPITIGSLITILAKYGPDVYSAAVKLLHTSDPTLADFEVLKTVAYKSAADYVKAATPLTEPLTGTRTIVP